MPDQSTIRKTNRQLDVQLTASRNKLNAAGVELRLFTALVGTADEANKSLSDFTQATFAGYAAKDMEGAWEEIEVVEDGLLRCRSEEQEWDVPGEGSEEILGWYLVADFDGDEVSYWDKFEAPHVMEPGGDKLRLRILLVEWALLKVVQDLQA